MIDVFRDTPTWTATPLPTALPTALPTPLPTRLDPFRFPRLPGRLAARPDLHRRLDRLAPVTIVEALPGFGKTTLVADWARAREHAGATVVWVRGDSCPPDPAALVRSISEQLAGDLPAPHRPSTERLLILVIDDAHLLTAPALHAVAGLVAQVPDLHLVGCGVTGHLLRSVSAAHDLECHTLSGADLALSADLLPELAAAWGHDLCGARARKLWELIGGWPLPLRLVLDATPRWSGTFATHVARDFLIQAVMHEIGDAELLAAASRLAVAPELTPEVTAALLADEPAWPHPPEPEQVLGGLRREGLLWRMPGRDDRPVWLFPRLVRRILASALEEAQPEVARAAHRTLARVLQDGATDQPLGRVLRHARLGEDWTALAALWRTHAWRLSLEQPREFQRAYADLPPEVTARHPSLLLPGSLARALADAEAPEDRLATLMGHYAQMGTAHVERSAEDADPADRVDLLTALLVARRAGGDLTAAQRAAESAASSLGPDAGPGALRPAQLDWFELHWGQLRLLTGDLPGAADLLTQAHQGASTSLVRAQAAGLLALVKALDGTAQQARSWVATHAQEREAGDWTATSPTPAIRLARATLALDALDGDRALAELHRVDREIESGELWALALAVATRHALLFGDPMALLARLEHVVRLRRSHLHDPSAAARHLVRRCKADLLQALGEANRAQAIVTAADPRALVMRVPAARLRLLTGDHRQATQIASVSAWLPQLGLRDRAELMMIKAAAQLAMGEEDGALRAFRRAHSLCSVGEFRDPYLLLRSEQRAMLSRLAGVEPEAGSAAVRGSGPGLYPEHLALVELTPRELEVLRQLLVHQSVSEIARALCVSVNTVKKQRLSLYTKLGAHDRATAIMRAERLGLLRPDQTGTMAH